MDILKQLLSERRYVTVGLISFLFYFFLYLFVTQFIVFGADQGTEWSLTILDNWRELIFRQRSPMLFESIGVISLPYVTLFLSVVNLIIALVLSELVAWNIMLSYFIFRRVGWKGWRGLTSLAGTIPALLGGAACCVPTLILVLGLQVTATLTTVWPWFVPLSFLLLIGSLWWAVVQAKRNPNICRNPK